MRGGRRFKNRIFRKYKEVEFFDTFKIEKITEIFSWADVGIIPTYFETFCRTVRHFLQANVVPIASEAFGIPDIIKSNVNGIILYGDDSI